MPTLDNLLVLAVIIGAMGLFVTEKLRVDLVALCVLVALLILGLIRPEQALHGFGNSATATVAAMFVLSAGLVRTGLMDWLARHLDRFAGQSGTRLVLVLSGTVAVLSAFIVNTATVAIFIPVAMALAKTRRVPASQVLMPLSFASQFGGVCTLIGTSTNILVNEIAVANDLADFGLFEFAPLGLALSAAGIAYLLIFGRWLLPRRKGEFQKVDKYRIADYLAELTVKEDSALIGQTWRLLGEKELGEVNLIKLIRGKKATWRAAATRIRAGDVLLVHGNADKLIKMANNFGLETQAEESFSDHHLSSSKVELFEVLVPPRSRLVGRTLRGLDFVRRYGCVVLAVQRRGAILRDRLADIQLDAGDALLLQCERGEVGRLLASPDLIVTNELTDLHLRKNRAFYAVGLVGLVVVLAALNVVPILVAALIGALGMVLAGCLTLEEAYQAIDWKVIFLLGGTLPLGLAFQQSGTAAWLVGLLLKPIIELGPLAVLAALYLITAVLTSAMSNNAAAILLAPIALSAAAVLGISPRPLLVAITFAASTSFTTPIGYQTNTMVYAPGGYRFLDFTRVGGPLNIVFWLIAIVLIPALWPF